MTDYHIFKKLSISDNMGYNEALLEFIKGRVPVEFRPILIDGVDGYGIYLACASFDWWLTIRRVEESVNGFEAGWVAGTMSQLKIRVNDRLKARRDQEEFQNREFMEGLEQRTREKIEREMTDVYDYNHRD